MSHYPSSEKIVMKMGILLKIAKKNIVNQATIEKEYQWKIVKKKLNTNQVT
jgi:hypothetical protein